MQHQIEGELQDCPRRGPSCASTLGKDGRDVWLPDRSCSYCGSLHPDDFMARVEAGDAELVGTDKDYKVYIHNAGGSPFKQTYRENADVPIDDLSKWTTREIQEHKFYWYHLSEAQKQRFIELWNAKQLRLEPNFGIYRWPYFMRPVGKDASA